MLLNFFDVKIRAIMKSYGIASGFVLENPRHGQSEEFWFGRNLRYSLYYELIICSGLINSVSLSKVYKFISKYRNWPEK